LSFPLATSLRRPVAFVVLLLIVLALAAGAADATVSARAGDDPDVTTTTAFDDGDQRIIPRPNSGHEPEDAGDRGGALQLTVLALIVVGVGVVGVKVFRQTQQVPR
jgi:hypothetical protein